MSFAELDTPRGLHPSRAANATWSGTSLPRQSNNLARQISQQFPRISNNLSSIRKILQVKSPNRMQLQTLLDTTSVLLANVAIDVKSMALSKEDATDTLLARQRRIEHHKLSKDLSSLRSEFQELQRSAKYTLRRSGWHTSSSAVHPLSSTTSSALEKLMSDQDEQNEPDQDLQPRILSDDKLRMSGLMIAERDSDIRKVDTASTSSTPLSPSAATSSLASSRRSTTLKKTSRGRRTHINGNGDGWAICSKVLCVQGKFGVCMIFVVVYCNV
jgi:hypothetical protein